MNEFELIAKLTVDLPSNASVVVGSGDDCAVVDVGQTGKELLFKTDCVVEGVHFVSDAPPVKIGHKALARCLSDIAAMGGMPTAALVTLGLPKGRDLAWAEHVYVGLRRLARKHSVAIVGGETTASPHGAFLSIALIGEVEQGRAILRSGAKPGDAIFVTGELGGSLQGKHLDFEPRLTEAQWLRAQFDIHAMIDVSDGLAGDLRHVLKASGVGAELLADAIPISRAAKLTARESQRAKPPLSAAMTDGEDFELLFTVQAGVAVNLLDRWKMRFPEIPLSCIGRITDESGLRVRSKEGVVPIALGSYSHFD